MKLSHGQLSAPRIEMLPLIDVVFLLLVFFIYAMLSMVVHHGQVVDLPVSSTVMAETQDAVQVTIHDTATGIEIFLDNERISMARFGQALRILKPDSTMQIFADKTVSYQELFWVMDHIKGAGLSQISLQTVVGEHE